MRFSIRNSFHTTVNFTNHEGALSIAIETERLHIKSVQANEFYYKHYSLLFGDPEVMAKYGDGKIKSEKEIISRIRDSWVKRLKQQDPFAGLAIFKKGTNKVLGNITLGYGDHPGEAELAYILHKDCWNQGYGTEAVEAVIEKYAPAILKKGFLLEGKPLTKIVATTREDNIASVRILRKFMHFTKEEERHGALRHHYSIDLNEIQKKSSKSISDYIKRSLAFVRTSLKSILRDLKQIFRRIHFF